jgi:hypothetical protein
MHMIAACLLAQASTPVANADLPLVQPATTPRSVAEEGPSARPWTIDLLVGSRAYDEDDWAPVDSQTSFGLLVSRRIGEDGWAIEAGASTSSDDVVLSNGVDLLDFEARFIGASLAARYIIDIPDSKAESYISVGVAWQESTIKARIIGSGPPLNDSEHSLGALLGLGVGWRATDTLRIGLDLRGVLGSETEFDGVDVSTDYAQVGVFVGAAF